MTAQHFVVTAPDGRQDVFANVQNAKSFTAAMIGSGKRVQPASPADLQAAGVNEALAASSRAGIASLMVAPMRPVASSRPTPRPIASAPSAPVRRAPPKSTLSLPDMMRKQHGLPLSDEGQAIMAAKAAADKDLKIDMVANMKRLCGLKD